MQTPLEAVHALVCDASSKIKRLQQANVCALSTCGISQSATSHPKTTMKSISNFAKDGDEGTEMFLFSQNVASAFALHLLSDRQCHVHTAELW